MRHQVFISYNQKDKKWLEEFHVHLKPFARRTGTTVWDATQIPAGAKPQEEISKALAAAKIVVLLVTPNYLESDFTDKYELLPLLKAAYDQDVTIFWIPVSASDYEDTDICFYQAAWEPDDPLDGLNPPKRNKVFVSILKKIKAALGDQSSVQPVPHPADLNLPPLPSLLNPAPEDLRLLVPEMFKRESLEGKFESQFYPHAQHDPQLPQVYIIPGEERERHDILIKRFCETHVQGYAERNGKELKLWSMGWPCGEDANALIEELRFPLLTQHDRYYYERSEYRASYPTHWLSTLGSSIIVIQHDIRSKDWEKYPDTAQELFEWYLQFWHGVESQSDKNGAQFVIFLNLVYTPGKDNTYKAKSKQLAGRLKTLIAAKDSARPRLCFMLDELPCIKPGEVMTLFRQNKMGLQETAWRPTCDWIFRSEQGHSDCQPMESVASRLEIIKNTIEQKFMARITNA